MIQTAKTLKKSKTGLKLLPYLLWLLPLISLNIGFRFLANIELFWQERQQNEIAQQELEALTRSSDFKFQLARHAGKFADEIEKAVTGNHDDQRALQHLKESSDLIFQPLLPNFKLHVFRKRKGQKNSELYLVKSSKIESKRAMSLIFDYMLDQRLGISINQDTAKKNDKIAESYFGKTARSEAFAISQKSKTTNILHENVPHWFFWDYQELNNGEIWGYFITSRVIEENVQAAHQCALQECHNRRQGLAGFVSLIDPKSPDSLFKELKNSKVFKKWRQHDILPFAKNLRHWLDHGPPATRELGRYRIYSHLGPGADYLSVFLSLSPVLRPTPSWIWLLNTVLGSFILLLSLRGIILNRWLETRLTFRFLMLYFLAATLPLGLLTITAVAYQYQFGRSAQNQIAANIESNLRQFASRRMQIQDDYQNIARKLFFDPELGRLIASHGISSDQVRNKILEGFKKRRDPLPILGFYLLDLSGKGLEYFEEASASRFNASFKVFRSPIINKLREAFAKENPQLPLPEYKVSEEDSLGAEAFNAISQNNLADEFDKRRGSCLTLRFGDGEANQIHNYIRVNNQFRAALYISWNGDQLFEKSIKPTLEHFKTTLPDYSFFVFRNSQQGLKTMLKPEAEADEELFPEAKKVAETCSTRGSKVDVHHDRFSIVAMPFGQNSGIIIAGCTDHKALNKERNNRIAVFMIIIVSAFFTIFLCSYFTAAFLLRPITDLKNALDLVAVGNYSVRLDSTRADELGHLTREFASMVDGIQERQRLAALLSDHAVQSLTLNEQNSSKNSDGKRFSGIAMVSDIRNFTTLCETYATREITEMLNDHFATLAAIIAGNGGQIYKFIGDAIEAVFTADSEAKNSLQAMKAAVEMNCAMENLNRQRAGKGQFTYRFGVGLAKGDFFAGSVGSDDTRLDYAIIGEPLNCAASLEAMSKACPGRPVVFTREIADTIENLKCVAVESKTVQGLTFADNDRWSLEVEENFAAKTRTLLPQAQQTENLSAAAKPAGFFQQNFKIAATLIFAVFCILIASGIYFGFAFRNQALISFNHNKAQTQAFRLIEQIKSPGSAKVAFEMRMHKIIKDIEAELQPSHSPDETDIVAHHLEKASLEFSRRGIRPERAFAITFAPASSTDDYWDYQPRIAWSLNISKIHQSLLARMVNYRYGEIFNKDYNHEFDELDPYIPELFGFKHHAKHISSELYGFAMQTKHKDVSELFYWNHVTPITSDRINNSLPSKNYQLSNYDSSQSRVAAIILFSIPEEKAKASLELLVDGYSEPGLDLAIIPASGTPAFSRDFPVDLLLSGNNNSHKISQYHYEVSEEQITLNNEPHRLIVAQRLPQQELISLRKVIFIVSALVLLLIAYLYQSIYFQTALTSSIMSKLIFSILLTAVIPMLTVAFVSDFFLTENHRAMIHQQNLELQRFIENYEIKQFYPQPITTSFLRSLTLRPKIVSLARELDKNPASEETRRTLRKMFINDFWDIDLICDGNSNVLAREAILIGKKDWEFYFSKSRSDKTGPFSVILSQLGKHILNQLAAQGQPESLSVKNVKNEIFFEKSLATIKSNFGDDAYVKLTCTMNQLVELEVTTGAAGLIVSPLPTIENPEYLLVLMVYFAKGSYLANVAETNKGPFAIFSIEYNKYGKLPMKFRPYADLGLTKAASWVCSSNLPVLFETSVGSEKVTLAGRSGVQQINNFLLGAASHTPIENETRKMQRDFSSVLLFTLIIFLFIAVQTASDIVEPVKALTLGMNQIGHQNYFYRIALDRHDELGELCASYDRFAKGLAEKEVMGKMVSKSALMATAKDAQSDDAMAGEKRNCVFVFVGIPEFTASLNENEPGQLFSALQTHIAQICRIILEEGGDIDKLMGDKILGVFPVSSENQSLARIAAVRAVKKIMQLEKQQLLKFPVAMGINAGEVISGMLGFGAKRDFTVIGDAVNVTARIQKEAEKLSDCRGLFSENFLGEFISKSEFALHSEVNLKGKSAMLKLYRLI